MGMTGGTGTGGMSILNMLNASATTTATEPLSTSALGLALDSNEESSQQGLGQGPTSSFGQSLLSMLNTSSTLSLNPPVGSTSALTLNNQDPSYHDTSVHRLSTGGTHTPIQRPSTASISGTPVVAPIESRDIVASGISSTLISPLHFFPIFPFLSPSSPCLSSPLSSFSSSLFHCSISRGLACIASSPRHPPYW